MSAPYQTLGEEFVDSWRQAARNLNAAIKRMQDNISHMRTEPVMREARSKARYRQAVARERTLGLTHVQREANRVRRELGLPVTRWQEFDR